MEFQQIVFVLMTIGVQTQATNLVQSNFKKLEPGQNITGTILTEFHTRSKLQYSDK